MYIIIVLLKLFMVTVQQLLDTVGGTFPYIIHP